MSYDPIKALSESGYRFDGLTTAQMDVFAGLSENEVDVINSIKDRLDGEVTAHDLAHGIIVW